jgi:hypothetical protein
VSIDVVLMAGPADLESKSILVLDLGMSLNCFF